MTSTTAPSAPSVVDRIAQMRGQAAPAVASSANVKAANPAVAAPVSRIDRFGPKREQKTLPVSSNAAKPAGNASTTAVESAIPDAPANRATNTQPSQAAQTIAQTPGQRARRAMVADTENDVCSPSEALATTWSDPSRPTGSVYSVDEWSACESAHPGHVVFEVYKSAERGLIAVPEESLGPVLSAAFRRSLLVSWSVAQSTGLANLPHSQVFKQHPEFGQFKYALIFSQQQLQSPQARRFALSPGMVLHMDKPSDRPEAQSNSRLERFRA